MAGGELRAHDGGAFGAEAIAFVRRFQVDYAICSATAINADRGFMLFGLQEAEFSREIMQRANTRIVAADNTKFGHGGPIVVCDPSMVDKLVTAQPFEHDPDLLFGRMTLARLPADASDDTICRRFGCSGFLSHLHSLVVTMSPKSSVTQSHQIGPRALTSDRGRAAPSTARAFLSIPM